MDTEQVAKKKVFGVPALYLIAGFVLILAVFAWRMKSTKTAAPTGADAAAADGGTLAGGTIGGNIYPNMPTGTVITPPPGSLIADPSTAPYKDNSTWMREAVAWLIAAGENPGTAQTALQHYLAGSDLTYEEAGIRDRTVRHFGLPPDITDAGGVTAPGPDPSTGPVPVDPGTGPVPVPVIPAPVVTPKKYTAIYQNAVIGQGSDATWGSPVHDAAAPQNTPYANGQLIYTTKDGVTVQTADTAANRAWINKPGSGATIVGGY